MFRLFQSIILSFKNCSLSNVIFEPPKTGNCQILDSNSPKVTYNDLKEIFNLTQSERQVKINKLKEKLDSHVEEEN